MSRVTHSRGVEKREELKGVKASTSSLNLKEDERKQLTMIQGKATRARDQREQSFKEFDDLTFSQAITVCKDARNSYLTPVENDGEVRVVTGTTESKVDALWNAVFNQNLESEIHAYSEFDVEDTNLGRTLTKVVYRTNTMEDEEDLWHEFVDELISMPAVFLQESTDFETYYDKTFKKGSWDDYFFHNTKDIELQKEEWFTIALPKKRIWKAEEVYLGDIRLPARLFDLQPYIFTYRQLTRDEAEIYYGKSPRWKYVRAGMPQYQEMKSYQSDADWRFASNLEDDIIEEVVYYCLGDDEMQIILNGVPMLPVGTPMRSRYKTYPLKMYVAKQIRGFAYGRPVTMMARMLQAIRDENFRLMILKYRQSIFKPIVSKAKVILNKDMWLPSAVTYGIDANDFDELVNDQVNSSDFGLNSMIEKEIENFMNVNALLQGQAAGDRVTAQEIAARMKQAMVMLGTALVSYMRAKRDMTYLRVYNVIENHTLPIGKRYNKSLDVIEDVYRAFSLSNQDVFDGTAGEEVIQFMDRPLTSEERQLTLDIERRSRDVGRPKRFSFINVKKLRALRFYFRVIVTAKEKRTSLMERESFKKDAFEAIQLGAQVGRPVNGQYLTDEYAKRTGLNPNKLFTPPAAPPVAGGMMPGGAPGTPEALEVARAQTGAPRTIQPNIQELVNPSNQPMV